MTQLFIVTTPQNSGDGTPLATAFNYTNSNFSELYARVQTSPPATLTGTTGDQAGMYAYDPTYFYYCFADYTGNSTIWGQVTQVGNVSISSIVNGTSNVSISGANANATIGINGTSNVAVFSTLGVTVSGIVSASGNVRGGNINTAGAVSATGNISGNYILGDGSQLTGLPATYGNANVAAYLPTYTGTLSPSSIYTNGYYYANSVPVTFGGGGSSNYSNANVAAFLPTYNGNLGGTLTTGAQPNVTLLGNLSGLTVNGLSSVTLSPVAASVTLAPTFGGQVIINPAGLGSINNMTIGAGTPAAGSFTTVSASGNVTGSYIIGDGSQLTNVPGGGSSNYSNANVAAFLPTYNGNLGGTLTTGAQPNVTLLGNLSGLTVNGLSSVTLSPVAASVTLAPTFGGIVTINSDGAGSINNMTIGAGTPQSGAFTTVSASGNVTGSYILGDGSLLTNLPVENYSNANVAAYLPTYTGDVASGNLLTTGQISAAGNIIGQYFIGNGSLLTGITGSGSTYTNANVAAYLPTYTGNLTAGNISVTGTTTSSVVGNVTGVVSGQLYGLVNGINTVYGAWDFGYIVADTYTNPLQWIFAQTSLGNIDMGTITAPASYAIDIGTIF